MAQASSYSAQGSTELIVILAIVTIIAIVSITLLTSQLGAQSNTSAASSEAYWMSAHPTGIYKAKTTLTVCNTGDRGYTMLMENHESVPIRLTGIKIDGQSLSFCRDGQAVAGEITLNTYESTAIGVIGNSSTNSNSISANVTIYYTSSSGIANIQHSPTQLFISNDLPPIRVPE